MTTLDSLPGELLRAIVCFQPETLRTLPFVNWALYAALLGPDVRDNEPHWRASITQRRWPAYAHVEAGCGEEYRGKSWKDLARGWRALLPWHYVHVRTPYWASCGNAITYDTAWGAEPPFSKYAILGIYIHCQCGVEHSHDNPVEWRDNFYRISSLPDPNPDGMIELQFPFKIYNIPRVSMDRGPFGWDSRQRSLVREAYCNGVPIWVIVAAPKEDLPGLPKYVSEFIEFI